MSKENQKKEVEVQKSDEKTQSEDKSSLVKKTTLNELGQKLPLPIEAGGKKFYDFDIFKWTMKQEKELGQLRADHKEIGIGRYVSMVLATMCSRIGPYDFPKMKFNEALLYISQFPMGTVYYIYCWLRYKSLGKEMGMKIDCTKCAHSFEFEADLETLDIRIADDIGSFYWDYELYEPFKIRGEEVKGFKMGPPSWNTTEVATDRIEGIGNLKESMIRGSIVNILGQEDKPTMFSADELDDMAKRDIEVISNKLEENYLGPDMSLSVRCDKCRSMIESQINWGYDNFFGISSR